MLTRFVLQKYVITAALIGSQCIESMLLHKLMQFVAMDAHVALNLTLSLEISDFGHFVFVSVNLLHSCQQYQDTRLDKEDNWLNASNLS